MKYLFMLEQLEAAAVRDCAALAAILYSITASICS